MRHIHYNVPERYLRTSTLLALCRNMITCLEPLHESSTYCSSMSIFHSLYWLIAAWYLLTGLMVLMRWCSWMDRSVLSSGILAVPEHAILCLPLLTKIFNGIMSHYLFSCISMLLKAVSLEIICWSLLISQKIFPPKLWFSHTMIIVINILWTTRNHAHV